MFNYLNEDKSGGGLNELEINSGKMPANVFPPVIISKDLFKFERMENFRNPLKPY